MNPTAAVVTGIRFAQDQTRQSSDIDGVSALHVPHHTEELWRRIGAGGGAYHSFLRMWLLLGFSFSTPACIWAALSGPDRPLTTKRRDLVQCVVKPESR